MTSMSTEKHNLSDDNTASSQGEPLPAVASGQPGSDLTLGNGMIRRTILPGGIRVITEKMPGVYSANLGVWTPRGSRDEVPETMGATHFLEHLLFKGTPQRSAKDIAELFDRIGGHSNAATGKEFTRYYATVVADDLPIALDCLLDMFRNASLKPADFELERGVIIDEIASDLDDGEEIAQDAFMSHLFASHPLGRPVGGTIESVKAATLEAVKSHYKAGYTPDQMVIAVAGNVDHEKVCDQVLQLMKKPGNPQWIDYDETAAARDFNQNISCPIAAGTTLMEPGQYSVEGNFEQAYLMLGGPGLAADDPREVTLLLLQAILGGGMSSRLFQRIREERGLAYNTYAFHSTFRDTGMFGTWACTRPENAAEVMSLMRAELERMGSELVEADELQRVKGQVRGSSLLALERTSARANHLAHSEIKLGRFISVQEKLQRAESVTAAEILELARELASNAQIEVMVRPQ